MDTGSIGGVSSALTQSQTSDAIATHVLKKAIDIQAQSVAQLIQALPQVTSNPPNLGNSIDVKT